MTNRADWPSGTIYLPRPKQDSARGHNLSASPDLGINLRVISPPRPTSGSALERILCLARARPRPPTTLRIPQTATPLNCEAHHGTARLTPPRPRGALISISATGNLDVIPCQDADAPCKQPLAHTPRCYNNYDMGSLSPGGSSVRTTLDLCLASLWGINTHNSTAQFTVTLACRRQDISPSDTTLDFTVDAPPRV
jgi:hypothetical protein